MPCERIEDNKKIKKILDEFTSYDLDHYHYRFHDCNYLAFKEQDVDKFNLIYRWLIKSKYVEGTVKNKMPVFDKKTKMHHSYWFIHELNHGAELIIKSSKWYDIKISYATNSDQMRGGDAFKIIEKTCAKFNINILDYAVNSSEGFRIKNNEIPKPMIKLNHEVLWKDKIIYECNHIDLNSAYASGIITQYPELREPFEYLYHNRKEHPEYKIALAAGIGFMQSYYLSNYYRNYDRGYCLAKLPKAALEYTNSYLESLTRKMRAKGLSIIAYNTDGIWYNNGTYHDENEGTELCQWKHDHRNCQLRFKSVGSYEFIEDGKYYPVVRGFTLLDKSKDREEWEWGDIYRDDATVLKYRLDWKKGYVKHAEKD